jgi:hypothetical protein
MFFFDTPLPGKQGQLTSFCLFCQFWIVDPLLPATFPAPNQATIRT